MRLSVTVLLLGSVLWARAQSEELIIQGQTGGLYLGHTVAAKETWYSVGRMYNIGPAVLSRYNHLTFSHSLVIGEELKVPLTAVNFSQDGKKPAGESLVPVYHIVQEKEWLYRISINHNKVPIPVLEKWNHVSGDEVHAGLHIIVGYLKVKTTLSVLAAGKTKVDTPAVVAEKKRVDTPVIVVEKRKADTQAVAAVRPAQEKVLPAASRFNGGFNGGKFKAEFSDGGKTATGQAGVFKSTSGWQDGKYYALINNVPVGTIVKITDQATGKNVYAKVLGSLPDMRESGGLMVRLSNAAAAELGEGEGKFGVGVSY